MKFAMHSLSLLLIVAGTAGIYRNLQESKFLLERSPLEEADALAGQGHWTEASLWLDWVIDSRPDLADPREAQHMLHDVEQQARASRLARFGKGMATGEADDFAGLAGSTALDLFVLGDIRDLVVQSYKQVSNDDGDMVIMALSGVGLATTVVPHVDWVPSLLKGFKRSGSFPSGLVKSFTQASETALKTGNFNQIGKLVNNAGTVITRLGPSGFKNSLKAVDDSGDLQRLAGASRIDPAGSYILASKFGHRGMQQLGNDGGNIVEVASKIKVMSRGVKIINKSLPHLPLAVWLTLVASGLALLFRRRILSLSFKAARIGWSGIKRF